MKLDDGKTQWLLTPVKAATASRWPIFKRRILIVLAVLLAYWIGTNSADGTANPATTPRPAYTHTQPSTVQPVPAGGEER